MWTIARTSARPANKSKEQRRIEYSALLGQQRLVAAHPACHAIELSAFSANVTPPTAVAYGESAGADVTPSVMIEFGTAGGCRLQVRAENRLGRLSGRRKSFY
jgi:hypothetical protein